MYRCRIIWVQTINAQQQNYTETQLCDIEKSRNMITLFYAVVGELESIPILRFMNDQQEFYPIPRFIRCHFRLYFILHIKHKVQSRLNYCPSYLVNDESIFIHRIFDTIANELVAKLVNA